MYTYVTSRGNSIYYSGYDANGKKINKKESFEPSLFVEDINGTHKCIFGETLSEQKTSIQDYKNYVFQASKDPSLNLFGTIDPIYQFISEKWPDTEGFDKSQINFVAFDIEVDSDRGFPYADRVEHPISAISLYSSKQNRYFSMGVKDFDKNLKYIDLEGVKLEYIKCESEAELIGIFITLIKKLQPDILTGWNIKTFDVPYFTGRARFLLGDKALNELSPFNFFNEIEVENLDGEKIPSVDFCIPILDYIELYKFFTYGDKESYSLDNIASEELEKEKLEYDGSLHDLYLKDHQKYIEYNIWDVALVKLLNDQMKLIYLATYLSYICKINFEDVFTTVLKWDVLLYNELKDRGYVIPPQKRVSKEPYLGGHVHEIEPCKKDFVVVYDINSLYPTIYIDWNVSPETLVENLKLQRTIERLIDHDKTFPQKMSFEEELNWRVAVRKEYMDRADACLQDFDNSFLKENNVSMTANMEFWSLEKRGFVSDIMEKIYLRRVEIKKKMKTDKDPSLGIAEQALKILLNSGYGAFANVGLRYVDYKVASAITCTGRMIIKTLIEKLNQRIGSAGDCFYCDTDSVMISMGPLMEKIENKYGKGSKKSLEVLRDKIAEVIEDEIVKITTGISHKFNNYKNTLALKREGIADAGIFLKKKRYLLRNIENGSSFMDKPKIKIKGFEIVRSTTPKEIKKQLRYVINEFLFDERLEDFKKYMNDYYSEYVKFAPHIVARNVGVSDIEKWLDGNTIKKGVPIHVRASILYNLLVVKYGLESKGIVQRIRSGDKVKYVYLKEPNPLRENVLAFFEKMPVEFGSEQYVDYETLFEKTMLKPLEALTEIFNINNLKKWLDDSKESIDNFFM